VSGSYLLDTDVMIPFLNGDVGIAELIGARGLYLSAVAIGELRFGAAKSDRVEENQARVDRLEGMAEVLEVTPRTSRVYGDVKAALKRTGRPIPENDIWIAAQAIQHGLTLISKDRHFDHVEGLLLERPASSAEG